MKNYFTIFKSKQNNLQTQKDYNNFLHTNENPSVDSMKKEIIIKEVGELFTIPDENVLREDMREYIGQDEDPFTSKKISSSLQTKLLQKQVLKDTSFNAEVKIPTKNKK